MLQEKLYLNIIILFSDSMRQRSYFQAFITGITLGIVNPGQNGVILKDPITGVGNTLAHLKDAVFHSDISQGVWIGKRIISGSAVGVSSYLTEVLNQNILHYAFLVNGKAYHLAGQKGKSLGSGTTVKISQMTEDTNQFEWFYKGKLTRTLQEIQQLIDQVNEASFQYHILFANCIDVAKAMVGYARGLWTKADVQVMILPESAGWQIVKGTGLLRGVQIVVEGVNLLKP